MEVRERSCLGRNHFEQNWATTRWVSVLPWASSGPGPKRPFDAEAGSRRRVGCKQQGLSRTGEALLEPQGYLAMRGRARLGGVRGESLERWRMPVVPAHSDQEDQPIRSSIPCLLRRSGISSGMRSLKGNAQCLRDRQDRAQRRVRWATRTRLTLLILLVGVAREPCPIGHLFLTKAGVFASTTTRCRQPLSVGSPLLVSDVVSMGHLLRFARPTRSYGLIRMA